MDTEQSVMAAIKGSREAHDCADLRLTTVERCVKLIRLDQVWLRLMARRRAIC